MSVELLYTSSEQGLKQGSRGFCTVVSTAGMPLNLANRLESLSGYRHVYPPNSELAGQNPVAFSHLRLSVGGRVISVISRVADYGLDYSQRTNKIAHHIVLDNAELPHAGPAWLMSQPGLFCSKWDGNCKTPGSGPVIPLGDQTPTVCRRWLSVMGDAGWAGALAESLTQPNSKPIWIIFSIEQSEQLLAMLNESISLLPAMQRWKVTFSTYATTIPPDIECRVRCVLKGSNEARLAPARGQLIDLTQVMLSTATGPLVILAREGPKLQITNEAPAISSVAHSDVGEMELKTPAVPIAKETNPKLEKSSKDSIEARIENFVIDLDDEFEILPQEQVTASPPLLPMLPRAQSSAAKRKSASSRKAILALASAAVIAVGVGILAWAIIVGGDGAVQESIAMKPEAKTEIEPTSTDELDSAETAVVGESDSLLDETLANNNDISNQGSSFDSAILDGKTARINETTIDDANRNDATFVRPGETTPSTESVVSQSIKEQDTPLASELTDQENEPVGVKVDGQREADAVQEIQPQEYTDGIVESLTTNTNSNMKVMTICGHVRLNVRDELYFRETWKESASFANFSSANPTPSPEMVNGWVVEEVARNSSGGSDILEVKIKSVLVEESKLSELDELVKRWNREYKAQVISKVLDPKEILRYSTNLSDTVQSEINQIKSQSNPQSSNIGAIVNAKEAQKKQIDQIKECASKIVDAYAAATNSRLSEEIKLSTGIELSVDGKNGWQPLILKIDWKRLDNTVENGAQKIKTPEQSLTTRQEEAPLEP